MDNSRELMYQKMDSAAQMELLGLKYFVNSEVCRLCLSKIPPNEPNPRKPKPIASLIQDINYCLNIVASQDTLCTKVCGPCSANVRKFAKFKRLCTRADEKFQNFLLKSKHKISLSSTVEIKIENVKLEINTLDIKKETSDDFFEPNEASQDFSDKETLLPTQKPDKKNKLKAKKSLNKDAQRERSTALICEVCDVTFPTKTDMTKHNLETHNQENSLYKCCRCSKTFKLKATRRQHETYYCELLKDGYFCRKCSSYMSTQRELEKHRYNHANNIPVLVSTAAQFQCSECKESYGIKARLIRHIQTHFITKKYVCETCGRGFAKKDYLEKHADIHTGVRRHQCPHCGFTSRQISSLVIHIRKHTGERPYHCDLCPRKCVTSSNLLAHRRRHLGFKQFQCTICGKQFGYKESLNEHVTVVHEQHRNFMCPTCGTSFARKRHLSRHFATKHPGVSWKTAMTSNGIVAAAGGVPSVAEKSDVSK